MSGSTTSFCAQASVLLLEERMCVLLPPLLKSHWGGAKCNHVCLIISAV